MAAPPKVVVLMPAYNAERTLRMTYEELPKDTVNLVILVDDGSTDTTLDIARELGLEIFVHHRNYGYGANQKTCYTEALKAGCEIVAMVHPDYQYDLTLVPKIIKPITKGEADLVLGSRLKEGGSAIQQGMPWWKYLSSRLLTGVENRAFGLVLSEYHTGYRAFTREVLETVNFRMKAGGFVFNQEIIAQAVAARFRIAEIAVPVHYFLRGVLGRLLGVVRLRSEGLLGRYAVCPSPVGPQAVAPAAEHQGALYSSRPAGRAAFRSLIAVRGTDGRVRPKRLGRKLD